MDLTFFYLVLIGFIFGLMNVNTLNRRFDPIIINDLMASYYYFILKDNLLFLVEFLMNYLLIKEDFLMNYLYFRFYFRIYLVPGAKTNYLVYILTIQ